MITFRLNILSPIAIAILFIYPNDQRVSQFSYLEVSSTYSSVEIYCWCLQPIKVTSTTSKKTSSAYFSPCTTFSAVSTEELMKEKYLVVRSDNKEMIAKVLAILRSGKEEYEDGLKGEDSRLVIVFKNANLEMDVYSSLHGSKFNHNSTTKITYNSEIVSSITRVLAIKTLNCTSR